MNDAHSPGALVAIALETYRAEIMPGLPPDQRYIGAMIANALEIALRSMGSEAEALAVVENAVLSGLGTGPAPNAAQLVHDIRADRTGMPDDNLRRALLNLVEHELAVRNPRYLKVRKALTRD